MRHGYMCRKKVPPKQLAGKSTVGGRGPRGLRGCAWCGAGGFVPATTGGGAPGIRIKAEAPHHAHMHTFQSRTFPGLYGGRSPLSYAVKGPENMGAGGAVGIFAHFPIDNTVFFRENVNRLTILPPFYS